MVDVTRCLSLASAVFFLGACSSTKPAQLDHAVARDHTLPFIDQTVHDTSVPDVARDLAHDLKPDLKLVDSTPPDQSKSPAVVGCSDGTREGFLDIPKFSRIAACAGAWSIKGIHNTTPACARAAGNHGTNTAGTGCNVTDLCAAGWHVCFGKVDVLSRNAQGCLNILDNATSPAFFLARTSSTGAFNCSQDSTLFGDPGTSNDLFGCGDLGCAMVQGTCTVGGANCDPLKACAGCPAGQQCANGSTCTPSSCYPLTTASHDLCKGLRNDKSCGDWCNHLGKFPALKNDWDCGTSDTLEANNVVKSDPAVQGGVLCCQD
jgi:hypothetical protein